MEGTETEENVELKVCGDKAGNSNRVNRGGSWNNSSRNCTASNRDNNNPDNRNNNLGFRLAASQHCDFKTGSQSPPHPCSAMPTKDIYALPVSRPTRKLRLQPCPKSLWGHSP